LQSKNINKKWRRKMCLASPKLPKAQRVTLIPYNTAILILDGSRRWENPEEPAHALVSPLKKFLARARDFGIPIIYTVSFRNKGKPEGEICIELNRRPSEPVIYPDGFDKFTGGELETYLKFFSVEHLVICGYRANISVLHTATKAAREFNYHVVIPMDGIAAKTDYELDYTLVHFTVLPTDVAKRFTFTRLDLIEFQNT